MHNFSHEDECQIRGRTVYYGSAPCDLHRQKSIGTLINHNGIVKRITGIEAFAALSEPTVGKPVGLMLEAL